MICVSVKARRLGYLKILSTFSLKNSNWSVRKFNMRFEDFALDFNRFILEMTEQSGIISPNNGKSARPYVELAESLELLIRAEKKYSMTEEFLKYTERCSFLSKKSNPFTLDDVDFKFFFGRLLKYDSEIVSTLLETVLQRGQDSVVSIRRNLITKLKESFNENTSEKDKLIIGRIDSSNFYSEELFFPRLHWLIDLNLLNKVSEKDICLTELGLKVCREMRL